MTNSHAVSISNVTKRYDNTVALDNVTLTVGNEVFGLLGANGAGKSTLFKLILGLIEPTAGTVSVAGQNSWKQRLHVRRMVGYLPEELRLYDRLTGWEFLRFVAGIKEVTDLRPVEADLEYFELAVQRDFLIEEYSQGMKKKIGIIAALMGTPRVVILDEPLNGLDVESMVKLRVRLEDLMRQGTTVMVSSHVLGFIERLCPRVAILKKGRLVIQGSPAEVRNAAGLGDVAFDDVFLHFAK